jgi:hypothetical protein
MDAHNIWRGKLRLAHVMIAHDNKYEIYTYLKPTILLGTPCISFSHVGQLQHVQGGCLPDSWAHWPYSIRPAQTLQSCVRISFEAWMSVHVYPVLISVLVVAL